MNDKITALLKSAGISATVCILGKFIHIDSFRSHDDQLQHILTAAGYKVLQARDGQHLCGYKGYRISAKLAA